MRRVTIKDVAREAGVSPQTVSRAINDKGEISPQTKTRILDISKRLGYRPNSVARSLVSQHTQNIGLVVPDVANPFFAQIARGIQDAAHAADFNIFLCNADENLHREIRAIHSLEAQRVDALILCSARLSDQELGDLSSRYQPLVLVNRRIKHSRTGCVLANDMGGAQKAVNHLLELGHRNIGMVAGPLNSHSGRERVKGYWHAMKAWGITPSTLWQIHCSPQAQGGYDATMDLLQRAPELTALLAYNDLSAVGVLHACQELGRCVPQSFSIIGYDDIYLASLLSPALTTVHIDKYTLGQKALQLALNMMECENWQPDPIVLDTRLVIRNSTAVLDDGERKE
ncbi:MAG: LacI family DNA-binding transcriptional regulator [Anaerolineae bacterium]|nr:LacI family DNA-binding transcriptional regulator [Anaerolineae bacterium]